MSELGRELPFQAGTLRERIIAELSFAIMDKGADAITIGDIRGLADRIAALSVEQSEDSESLRRENQALQAENETLAAFAAKTSDEKMLLLRELKDA